MTEQWKSIGLYEHPAEHQVGVYGNVVLSQAGIYCLRVGRSIMSCPQDWAGKIHKNERVALGQMIYSASTREMRRQIMRISNDEYRDGRLINGYDYDNQAWVKDGNYLRCGHPTTMACQCYGKEHEGEETK